MTWTDSIYDAGDLSKGFQDFSKPNSFCGRVLRQILLLIHLGEIQLILWMKGPYDLAKYLTNWLLVLNTIWIFTTVICNHLGRKAPKTLLAIHHMLFEVIVPGHMLVVSVYWSMLHKTELAKRDSPTWPHQGFERDLDIMNLYMAHIMPAVSALINFYLTDVCIKPTHGKVLTPLAIGYAIMNYYEV